MWNADTRLIAILWNIKKSIIILEFGNLMCWNGETDFMCCDNVIDNRKINAIEWGKFLFISYWVYDGITLGVEWDSKKWCSQCKRTCTCCACGKNEWHANKEMNYDRKIYLVNIDNCI